MHSSYDRTYCSADVILSLLYVIVYHDELFWFDLLPIFMASKQRSFVPRQ